MSDEQPVLVEHDGPVAVVTLNRPNVLNALSQQLFAEFYSVLRELDDDDATSVIVVTGAGERAFSAGADIKEMARNAQAGGPPPRRDPEDGWRLATSRKPTVAALNGLCYGGGAVLASSLDIRVGCDRTRFRYLAVTYGRINSTWLLPTLVGLPMARELLFTGRVVEPDEAYRIGLLNHLVEPDQVLPKALEIAHQIAGNDQRMVQGAKRLIDASIGAAWREMFENEIGEQQERLQPTPVLEGFREFIDRKGVE